MAGQSRPIEESDTEKEIPESQRPATYTTLFTELETADHCRIHSPDPVKKRTPIDIIIRTNPYVLQNDHPIQTVGLFFAFGPWTLFEAMRTEPPPNMSGMMERVDPHAEIPQMEDPIVLEAEEILRMRRPPLFRCVVIEPISKKGVKSSAEHCRTCWIEGRIWVRGKIIGDPLHVGVDFPHGMHLSPRIIPLASIL